MEATLSAKYAKATQQLQRKNEEVERLMIEAKSLDSDNRKLVAENTSLRGSKLELETQLDKKNSEFKVLELQVKKQQLRLQEFIDREANNAAARATKQANAEKAKKEEELESKKTIEELTNRLRILSDSRQSLSEAADLYKKTATVLSEENEGLRKQVAELDSKLADIVDSRKKREDKLLERIAELEKDVNEKTTVLTHVDRESAHIAELDVKAKDALKTEFIALVAEVDRLQNEVENERQVAQGAKEELAQLMEQTQTIRRLHDESSKLATAELDALTKQQESMLKDLRSALKDRDTARTKETELEARLREQRAATEQAISAAKAEAERKIAEIHSQVAQPTQALMETLSKTERELDGAKTKNEQLTRLLDQRQQEIHQLKDELSRDRQTQRQMLDNSALIEEKNALQSEYKERIIDELTGERNLLANENALLQQRIDELQLEVRKQTKHAAMESTNSSSTPSLPLGDVEQIDKAIHALLVSSTQLLHETPSAADLKKRGVTGASVSRSSSVASDTPALPTVPSTKFKSPLLNSMQSQCGGLDFVLKKLSIRVKRLIQLIEVSGAGVGAQYATSDDSADEGEGRPKSAIKSTIARLGTGVTPVQPTRQQATPSRPPLNPRIGETPRATVQSSNDTPLNVNVTQLQQGSSRKPPSPVPNPSPSGAQTPPPVVGGPDLRSLLGGL